MKSRVLLPLVLIFVLCVSSLAFAGGDVSQSLNSSTLLPWVRSLEESTAELKANKQPKDADDKHELGYAYFYDFCTLYYSAPNREEGKLLALELNDSSVQGPRNEQCYDELSSLLDRYPNDNKMLVGDRDFALLYQDDRLPDSGYWAYVNRDGQRISSVEYYINERMPNDRYSNIKLSYRIVDGRIDTIGVYGLQDFVSEDEVKNNLKTAEKMGKLKGYFQYKTSSNGAKLEMFEREDLSFSDIDFLSLSPDILIERFGKPDNDEKIDDEDGKYFRSMSWSGVEANFLYNKNDELLHIVKLLINDDIIEGPRGCRVGDGFPLVYSRFRSAAGSVGEDNKEIMYGDGENAPYGIISYLPDAVINMQMSIEVDLGKNKLPIALSLNFDHDTLNEILLYVKE